MRFHAGLLAAAILVAGIVAPVSAQTTNASPALATTTVQNFNLGNGNYSTSCVVAATGRTCIIAVPSSTTACALTIPASSTLSGLTAAVQTASDFGTTYTNDPFFGNANITAAGTYSGPIVFAPASVTPTTVALNVTAYTSGTATVTLSCNQSVVSIAQLYPANGAWTGPVATGASNTVVSSHPGRIVNATITTAGTTGNTTCFDNATTNSGTIVAVINGTTASAGNTAGITLTFNMPLQFGLTCAGAASSPAFTAGFM